MDRINTCVSLFFGYDETEKFIYEMIRNNCKLNQLDPLDRNRYLYNIQNEDFLEYQKQTKWYKMIEEIRKTKAPKNDKLVKMIISLCALIIGLNKEDIIDKNNSEFNVLVRNDDFYRTISFLSKNKNGKICIGEIEFDSESECLQFVRNKLLHGDYHIKDQFIILKKDGKIGKINYEFLLSSCIDLSGLIKCRDKCIEHNMVLYQKKDKTKKDCLYVDEVYDVKLTFRVRGKREISLDIMSLISDIEDYIYEYNIKEKLPITKSIELALKKYESVIARYHIDIDFDILSFSGKPKNEVQNKFNEMVDYFVRNFNVDKPSLEDIFQYFNLNNFDNSKDYFNDNFLALATFIKGCMRRNWASKYDRSDQEAIHYRDISSALDILKFYCYFNYGLDNISFSGEEISLKSLFNGKHFDYSKLDLSLFDDPNMRCDVTFGSYLEQMQGISSDFESAKEDYLKQQETYDKFIEKYGDSRPNVEQIIKGNLDYKEGRYNEKLSLFEFASNFDVNKYVRNLNIIYHIRNSIAHGNYEIDKSDCENVKYIFRDIHEGNVSYCLSIGVEDFRKLFNCKALLDSFYDGLVSEYSYDELFDREIYYDCMYVRSEKRSDWDAYVEDVLSNGDESDRKVLGLTYEALENINRPAGAFDSRNEFVSCIVDNVNDYLKMALHSIEVLQHGVSFDGKIYTIDEFERMLKNIFIYDDKLYRWFYERIIIDGDEGTLLRKVLSDLGYKGLLSNYYTDYYPGSKK